MSIIRTLAVAVMGLATLPASAPAQRSAAATAGVQILRPVTISASRQLNFGRVQPQRAGNGTVTIDPTLPVRRTADTASALPGGTETPAVFAISGEPGRAYRISVPGAVPSSPGGYVVDRFRVWTASQGLVSASAVGRFDTRGQDTVQVGGTIAFQPGAKQEVYTATVAISIAYE